MNKYLIIFIAIFFLFIGCSASISIIGESNIVFTEDGYPLQTYDLKSKSEDNDFKPRAIFFYIQGSEYKSVLNKTGMLASAILFGSKMIVSEKRGVTNDNVDIDICYKYSTKDIRINDHLKVIDYYLKKYNPGIPVILIGGSEGGDIASVIASREKRITHLILIGSGGGWSQETELKYLVNNNPGYLNLKNAEELQQKINSIYNDSDDTKTWAGHPYKRWKSFLRDSAAAYLQNVDLPILLIHGTDDKNVPVESSRELKSFFSNKGKLNLTYIEYENADHSFYNVKRKVNIYPILEIDIISWLQQTGIITLKEKEQFVSAVKSAHPEVFK